VIAQPARVLGVVVSGDRSCSAMKTVTRSDTHANHALDRRLAHTRLGRLARSASRDPVASPHACEALVRGHSWPPCCAYPAGGDVTLPMRKRCIAAEP
jgi:hypothetical protein